MIQKVSVHIFQKHYIPLIELIIDNRLDDLYMLPPYLLQFGFEYKTNKLSGLALDPHSLKYCIIPQGISEELRVHPLIGTYYSIEAHAASYEKLIHEIFCLKDSSIGEKL